MKRFLFFLIFLLGFFLRFYNLNWDSNYHLHPDERFLTMVANKMRLPSNLNEYLDQQKSLLNPFNIGENFYVYGVFPLVLTKFIAVKLNLDDYNNFTILGRGISAFFELMTLIFVYKTANLLLKIFGKYQTKNKNIFKYLPFASMFFYAISVYPIQSAHFFTNDTFLNFFIFGSFYFILKFYFYQHKLYLFLSGIFFGLSLSSKISGLYIFPLNLLLIFLFIFKEKNKFLKKFINFLLLILFYLISAYLTLRLANPYYFSSNNFFDFKLNKQFVSSINLLIYFSNRDAWYPPGVQWINKPWWGLLSTTFFAGLGPINSIVMFIGIIWLLKNLKFKIKNSTLQLKIKNEGIILYLILFWVIGYFVYQLIQFVKSIRYTIYLYPFFAIFGGIGIAVVSNRLNRLKWVKIGWNQLKSVKIGKFFLHVIGYTFYITLLIWPMLFFTIYLHKNIRIEASEWIYKNLPNNAVILGEHWDDPLPFYVENSYMKNFQVELLPIFDPDTNEKWQKMKDLLEKADYYVLSSNRGWGSIPTVPERYPIMSDFYKKLFNEECFDIKINCKFENCYPKLVSRSHLKSQERFCFRKIKEFLPYYYKFIRYPDSWIEETFTVYDHQTVYIYEKIKKY